VRLLGRRATLWLAALLLAAPFMIAGLGQYSDIDLLLADAVFDAALVEFPLRHTWLTEDFNHGWVKAASVLVALVCMSRAVSDALLRNPGRTPLARMRVRIVALAALLVPLTTSLLKYGSASHCPWDLRRYGGNQPYLRLLDPVPPGWDFGHCLPAGHASSVFWMVAFVVYWLPEQPRQAARFAAAAVATGALIGIVQQLRGAHFLTHTLWSGWIACVVVFVLVQLMQAHSQRPEIALPCRDA
jgi:membrane-associated PAP2 superfamily phosphatase